jgi:hypothetical protein
METKNNEQELNSDYNKESKYREEIFQLLENVINTKEFDENQLFRKLFKADLLDSEELIELIKKLK